MKNSKIFTSPKEMLDIPNYVVGRRTRLVEKLGWRQLPNVSGIRCIELDDETNKKLGLLGLQRKKRKIEYVPHTNRKANRYMAYQLKRLELRKSDPEKFFRIVNKLLWNSTVFRMAAMQKVNPDWIYENTNTVMRTLHKVKMLAQSGSHELKSWRVYIPKGETYRPLGVPSLEWRILLHMHNNFLFQYTRSHFLKTQHGFIKGRGVLTAWIDLLRNAIKKPWIYECDLKQFFPSLEHCIIRDALEYLKVPEYYANWLIGINENTPILPKKMLLNEDATIGKEKNRNQGNSPLSFAFESELGVMKWDNAYGVAQGAPCSPLISIMPLTDCWQDGFLDQQENVSYADDPIFYGDEEFTIEDREHDGIVTNKEKSFWLKRNGVWEVAEFKYLGLTYHPISGSLKNTKKDFTVTLDEAKKILTCVRNKIPSEPSEVWRKLLQSAIGGYVLSRIQNGSWDETKNEIVNPSVHRNSYVARFALNSKNINVINGSSYAFEWLLSQNRGNKVRYCDTGKNHVEENQLYEKGFWRRELTW